MRNRTEKNTSPEELVAATRELIAAPERARALGAAAAADAEAYGKPRFRAAAEVHLRELLDA